MKKQIAESTAKDQRTPRKTMATGNDNGVPPSAPDVTKFAIAFVQDTSGCNDVYRFRRVDGKFCFAALAVSLSSRPQEVLNKLCDLGLDGATHLQAKDIVARAAYSNPARHGTILLRGGWIGTPGNSFALPNRIVRGPHQGALSHEYFLAPTFDLKSRAQLVSWRGSWAPSHLTLKLKGSTKAWNREIAKRALNSSAAMLAISASFAAPFLRLTNEPPFGILVTGDSTGGKTTLTLASASVVGIGAELELANWNTTAAGLAQEAEIHSDLCFHIDDIKNYSGSNKEIYKLMIEVAYRTTAGMRKMAHRESVQRISGRPAISHGVSAILLTSAEMGLDALAKAAGEETLPEGVGVRFIEVPILSRKEGGIFDRLKVDGEPEKQMEQRAKMASDIKEACKANHGWPLVKLLETITADPDGAVAAVQRYRNSFVGDAEFDRTNPYQLRHAHRFAFLFATTAYAIDKELLPWTHAQLRSAILSCHKASHGVIDERNVPSTSVERVQKDGLERLKELINSPARFSAMGVRTLPAGGVGWREKKLGRKIYYIRGDVWRRGIFQSAQQRDAVERYLIGRKQLRADAKGPVTVQPSVGNPGKRTARCYELVFRMKRRNSRARRHSSLR